MCVTRSLVSPAHIFHAHCAEKLRILMSHLLFLVASKCGFDVFGNGGVTNSASHIKTYIDGTIDRLGFTPDLYYLHRIDPSEFDISLHWYTLYTKTCCRNPLGRIDPRSCRAPKGRQDQVHRSI